MKNFSFEFGVTPDGVAGPLENQANSYGYTLNGFGKLYDEAAYCLDYLEFADVLTDDEYWRIHERMNVGINKRIKELPYPREKESHDVYYVVFQCGKCGEKERMKITDWLEASWIMKYLKMWKNKRCSNPECEGGRMFFVDIEQSKEKK